MSPCCQFPRLLPFAAHRPVVQAWSGDVCRVCWWHLQTESMNLVLQQCFSSDSRSDCSVSVSRLNPHNFCRWGIFAWQWVNPMLQRKTISLGTLRGAKSAPEPNQGRTQRGHSPQLGGNWAGLPFCVKCEFSSFSDL